MPFIESMTTAYAACDFVVCRAGAITCAELIATGTPGILIPARAGRSLLCSGVWMHQKERMIWV